MYLELDDKLIERLNKTTITCYELKGNLLPSENIVSVIEDLLCEIEKKEEQLEDMEADMKENYRPLTNRELYE